MVRPLPSRKVAVSLPEIGRFCGLLSSTCACTDFFAASTSGVSILTLAIDTGALILSHASR